MTDAQPLSDEELAELKTFCETPYLSYPEEAMPMARRLLATITALKEQVADMNKDIDGLMTLLAKARGERDALRKEVAELKSAMNLAVDHAFANGVNRGRDEQREKDADFAHETMRAFSKGSLRRPGSMEGYGEYIAKAIRESKP